MKRKQLTLFLDPVEAVSIERVRARFNPAQRRLIAAHVTLCREDELADMPTVLANLAKLSLPPFTLEVGTPERFWEGKGVFLPVMDERGRFGQLRAAALKDAVGEPRAHVAHVTLMHPRNSTCTDLIFEEIAAADFPRTLSVRTISMIEQTVGQPWRTLETFPLSPCCR